MFGFRRFFAADEPSIDLQHALPNQCLFRYVLSYLFSIFRRSDMKLNLHGSFDLVRCAFHPKVRVEPLVRSHICLSKPYMPLPALGSPFRNLRFVTPRRALSSPSATNMARRCGLSE